MSKGAGKTTVKPVEGVKIGVAAAGIRRKNRNDLVLIEIDRAAKVAAVFTQNQFCAAPVEIAKKHFSTGKPGYLIVNTGYANAGMGKQGLKDALQVCQAVSQEMACDTEAVIPFSTGIIGEPLPVKKIIKALPALGLSMSTNNWMHAAEAIMTTDTRPKVSSARVKLGSKMVTITGIAKGAGMIKPNMATMLAYVATDANMSKSVLKRLLKEVVSTSFNRITVDGDTSTNDACVLIATGKAGNELINSEKQKTYGQLKQGLEKVFVDLAQKIIRDAEGATKFITLQVKGGKTDKECLQAAYAVAESPLVKTAFFASDPNWGRIVAAVGRSGIRGLDCNKIKIYLGEVLLAEKGGRASSYREASAQKVMNRDEITITIELGRGKACQTVWTSDLSHDYVKINAEYRS